MRQYNIPTLIQIITTIAGTLLTRTVNEIHTLSLTNAFENVVCKMATVLCRLRWVNANSSVALH